MEQQLFRHRHDGWTIGRQAAFLDALKEIGCVRLACKHVGLTSTSAYRARKRMPAFAEAWDLALRFTQPALERAAFDRAIEGWLEPIVHQGKIVGERRRYSDNLLRALLLMQERRRVVQIGHGTPLAPAASQEEVDAALMKRLESLGRFHRDKARLAQ